MIFVYGLVALAVGLLLLRIGSPKAGVPAAFLQVRFVEGSYALLITTLISGGVAAIVAGAASLLT